MQQIAELVKDSGWNSSRGSDSLRDHKAADQDLLRGRVSRFSIDALVNITAAPGRAVHFSNFGWPEFASPKVRNSRPWISLSPTPCRN